MAEPKRVDLTVKQKRAILVAVVLPGTQRELEEPLDELRGLAETAGVKTVGTLVQNRQVPDAATYLGKGKLAELKTLVALQEANTILFDNNLSPAQTRNLEQELETEIVDRSELILAIFATHARSYESRLQVELAQLLYMRPRLKRLWTHLERTEGAVGSRGPGEQQLETDRRLIDSRVSDLRQRLKTVERRRERQVSQRRDYLTVSLVGYTNAGKSTLMNALTGAGVFVANQLFATLDTRTRAWKIPNLGRALLSDTVGFIRDLPHNLVASFRSTLEEARHADLLLHVVDASSPAAEQQIATVNDVLKEIGIDARRAVLVLNKIDAVRDRSYVDVLRASHEQAVSVSAVERTGLEQLSAIVRERLGEGYVDATLETSVGNGRLLAYLAAHAEVVRHEYVDSRVTLFCRIPRRFLNSLPGDDARVHLTSANGAAR
ncbi:MAG TPA: GTPase HflX [Planctomycetaceae bacterium]|nr:GTPase HflX [Planctomycetaceae bacterium]